MEFDWAEGKLAEGLKRYEAGEFFLAHEAWESVWLNAFGADRVFLQALIQVAAAFHHQLRNNQEGKVLLLRAALLRLESCPPCFGGISVSLLRDDICKWLDATTELSRPLVPPRICPIQSKAESLPDRKDLDRFR